MVCVVCGRAIQRSGRGRRRIYCSDACRQRAYRLRDLERMWRSSESDPEDTLDIATILDAILNQQGRR